MKQIFTLMLAGILCHATNAQLLLNEIYTDPSSGNNEFFELYNADPFPEETDNYTLVTYYKTPTQQGLYVLDMPAATAAGKGFYVGSSAIPFNYQGVSNSGSTSFNWNDPAFLASNGGSLSRWQLNNGVDANPTDGNANYDYSNVVTTNDLFQRNSGSGSSFVVFLYKNGVLVNSALLASGGATTVASNIVSMPPLFVDMQGSSPDFTINFSTYGHLPVEAVNQEAGSDNGFIRQYDGACGAWTKSSAQVNHTPLAANGQLSLYASGSFTVNANIVTGNETDGSTLSYNLNSVPATAFPLEVSIYVDKGNMLNQLDATDSLLEKQTITSTGSNYTLNFKPFDRSIFLIVKTSSGCVDNIELVQSVFMSTLPVKLLNFNVAYQQNKPVFGWAVANNEEGKYYELQNSTDKTNFQTMTILTNTGKPGNETYSYKEPKDLSANHYYRLKTVDKANHISYSSVLKLSVQPGNTRNFIQLTQNPVASQLLFNSVAEKDVKASVNIYSMLGVKVFSAPVYLKKGINSNTVNLEGNIKGGSYLLEVVTDSDRSTIKFIKY